MGFLTTDQLYIAFGLITAIDLAGTITSWQEHAWLAVALAFVLVPFDLFSLHSVTKYDTNIAPDYSIHDTTVDKARS